MRVLRLTLFLLVLGAALLALFVFVFQRRALYFPRRMTEESAFAEASRLGLAPWRDGRGAIRGWRSTSSGQPRARVLVLHGNAGAALDRTYYVQALAPLGLDVVLLEYPGYGPRAGFPSLDSLTTAAVEAVDDLAMEGAPVWLVGESLGSGVAARAATERPDVVHGILLVTPFADLATVAHHHFPFLPAFLLRDRFVPVRDLAAFRGPIAVIVAGRDEVVTASEGRRLFAALSGPKRLFEQPEATHNGLDLSPHLPLWEEAVRFLEMKRR
jgi:pimeloyl-ACP methyl ester carboxylesterase